MADKMEQGDIHTPLPDVIHANEKQKGQPDVALCDYMNDRKTLYNVLTVKRVQLYAKQNGN